jgi:hypothetical protein
MSGQPSIRKGKWIPTEEAYTLQLMAEVKNAAASPLLFLKELRGDSSWHHSPLLFLIPEGTTLRQFLAQSPPPIPEGTTLNCDPLRIYDIQEIRWCRAETLSAISRFQRFGKSTHIDITTGLSLCISKCAHLMLCIQGLEQQETTRNELGALASQFHEDCQELRQAQMALEEDCDTSSTLQEPPMPTAAQHALKMELEAAVDRATNAVVSGKTKVVAARQQLSEFVLACKAFQRKECIGQ